MSHDAAQNIIKEMITSAHFTCLNWVICLSVQVFASPSINISSFLGRGLFNMWKRVYDIDLIWATPTQITRILILGVRLPNRPTMTFTSGYKHNILSWCERRLRDPIDMCMYMWMYIHIFIHVYTQGDDKGFIGVPGRGKVEKLLHVSYNKWGFPKIRGTLLGVPIIRTIIFRGLYWGPAILGNYQIFRTYLMDVGPCQGICEGLSTSASWTALPTRNGPLYT